jgi:hypothetical protein
MVEANKLIHRRSHYLIIGSILVCFGMKIVLNFFLYGRTPQDFAPDENTYSKLNDWIFSGGNAGEFPLSGGDLFYTSLSFNLPTQFLIYIGIPSIFAIRLISSIYSLFCALLIYKFLLDQKETFYKKDQTKVFNAIIPILVLIYLTLPSHFIWSSLGLRESANEFWLLAGFYALKSIIKDINKKINYLYLFATTIVLFYSRPETTYVFMFTAFIIGIYFLVSKRKILLLLSIISAYIFITVSFAYSLGKMVDSSINQNVQSTFTKPIDQLANINNQVRGKKKGANTAIPTYSCPILVEKNLMSYGCLIYNLPKTSWDYVYRPFFIVDDLNTNIKKFVAVENIFWIMIFMLVYLRVIYLWKYIKNNLIFLSFIIFITTFVIISGVFEGNFGTAFRHKSLLLPLLLITTQSLFFDKQKRSSRENFRFNSSRKI